MIRLSVSFVGSVLRPAVVACMAASIFIAATAVARADFRAAAKKLMPATVRITRVGASHKTESAAAASKSAADAGNNVSFFLRDGNLFRRVTVPNDGTEKADAVSVWCGVLVSADGLIATVADGPASGKFEIQLADGRTVPARLCVNDHRTGLWLLKAEISGVPFVQPAAGNVEIGEDVVESLPDDAKSRQIAPGIVSATGRRLPEIGPTLIQTTLPLLDAGAGAPVANAAGELVGIMTMAKQGHPPAGATFVIPGEHLKSLLGAHVANGVVTVQSGRIGISLTSETCVVKDVIAGGPAAKAGLKMGDVIESMNGERFASSDDLTGWVRMRPPGTKTTVKYRRAGRESAVDVVLGGLQESGPTTKTNQPNDDVLQFTTQLMDVNLGTLRLANPGTSDALNLTTAGANGAVQWAPSTTANPNANTWNVTSTLPVPQAVVHVEKSDVEKGIEKLRDDVKSLRTKIDQLHKELTELTQALKKK